MKKIALSILSIFILFGGLFLSACDKKVSLSMEAQYEQIEIYTNHKDAENYQTKTVKVTLKNSDNGIGVDVLSGEDSVHIDDSSYVSNSNGECFFTIVADSSGEAKLRVYAIEDNSQSAEISVSVKTRLERVSLSSDDDVDGSARFAIRGRSKQLLVGDYFDLYPLSANDKEVVWEFDDPSLEDKKVLVVNGQENARIDENNFLHVGSDATVSKIALRAYYANDSSIAEIVELEVLDNSTIETLTVGGVNYYQSGVVNGTIPADNVINLKRNDSSNSVAQGTLVVNTQYDIDLLPEVYTYSKDGGEIVLGDEPLSDEEFQKYFEFNITSINVDKDTNQTTYTFTIDARDAGMGEKCFGDFCFFFNIKYVGYKHEFSTKDDKGYLLLDIDYTAVKMELLNAVADNINGALVDVYSSYTDGDGLMLTPLIFPDDVAIDNDTYQIVIDLGQEALNGKVEQVSDFLVVTNRGRAIAFSRKAAAATTWVSENIQNGSVLYLAAANGGAFDILEDVTIEFKANSNPSVACASLNLNLYQITTGAQLLAKKAAYNDESGEWEAGELGKTYVSSSIYSRNVDFTVMIEGLTSLSGLSLKSDGNSHFKFSELEFLNYQTAAKDKFVVVAFEVELVGYNFDDQTSFWFEHVTGKVSEKFEVAAFVPLSSATISTADGSNSSVFVNQQQEQAFVLKDGDVQAVGESSNSLSKIVLEAGITLPIDINYQNASLKENGIQYSYLSLEEYAKRYYDGADEELTAQALEKALADFLNFDGTKLLELATTSFDRFQAGALNGLLSVSEKSLDVVDTTFQGFVAVEFKGYDENHQDVTVVRFFAIESFNSVRTLASNVVTKELYTTETLSQADMRKSYVDVSIALRYDQKTPTYSNDLSYFTFTSLNMGEESWRAESGNVLKNDWYVLSNFSFANNGRVLKFRITANSTQLQQRIKDTLTIFYADHNGVKKQTSIELSIKNAQRVESVEWVNKTGDASESFAGEIYLNATSAPTSKAERDFTVSMAISPTDANDTSLRAHYVSFGNESVEVTPSASGTEFLVTINESTKGGYGNLYFMPNDMVKVVDSVTQVLVYKYTKAANGELIETPVYVELSAFDGRFENILNGQSYEDLMGANENGDAVYSNFFINNDGEVVLYRDVIQRIRVTVADGTSQETAIRIYNSEDFKEINYAYHYKVMNNLTFSNWKTLDGAEFVGSIIGKDENVTLTFGNNSQTFMGRVGQKGLLQDLIFAGTASQTVDNKTASGFVANVNNGTIKNVSIDVYYQNGEYKSSTLNVENKTQYVGSIVGQNNGTIENVYAYGATLVVQAEYVGGLVGDNSGIIRNSGVEFYNFSDGMSQIYVNSFAGAASTRSVGGIAGHSTSSGLIEKSYAYAYSLEDAYAVTNGTIVAGNEQGLYGGNIGAIVGYAEGGTVSESFAFVGDIQVISASANYTIKNSYVTYYNVSQAIASKIFVSNAVTQTLENDAKPTITLDDTIWQTTEIDSDVNFGYVHLKNVAQSVKVETSGLKLKDNTSPNLKMLVGRDGNGDAVDSGILFVYRPTATVTAGSVEDSQLQALNTLAIADLFEGLSAKEARSLLVNTDSRSLTLSANSIQMAEENLTGITLTVYSKMDFTNARPFNFIVMNALPTLMTTVDGQAIQNEQTVLLQTTKSRSVVYNTINSVYLNGVAYALEKDTYDVAFSQSEQKYEDGVWAVNADAQKAISVAKSNNSLVLKGEVAHEKDNRSRIESNLVVKELEQLAQNAKVLAENDDELTGTAAMYEYAGNAIKRQLSRVFNVSVYKGATALSIKDASALEVKPSQYAVFDVEMVSDNASDDIVLGLQYGEIEISAQKTANDNELVFNVDNQLWLEMTWVEISEDKTDEKLTFRVTVKVVNDKKHLVAKNYDNLTIFVNAESQKENSDYVKTIKLNVKTEDVEDVKFSTYSIGSRQIKNSVLYLKPSEVVVNTLTPSSDAIMAVSVSPQFAKMSHFKLTYEISGSGKVGTISLSRLSYTSLYGYYVNPQNVSFLTNGLEVEITEQERKDGNGVYYFRIYVSSAFQASSALKFKVEFFDREKESSLAEATHDLKIDFMPEAAVKVNGASTTLLAKGESATVSITVAKNQTLYNNTIHLQNNGSNISLSSVKETEYDNYKVYTATLTAYVNATVVDKDGEERDSGIFYVVAAVERVINGKQEIKESVATVCLVDFSLDSNGISINSNGTQQTYNGKSYDVFYSYINATDTLSFNYPLLPEEYNYDPNDAEEVKAVEALQEKRGDFLLDNNYKDEQVGYYINHKYDEATGEYVALDLKQQLWYAEDETSSTKISNGYESDNIIQNSRFAIFEDDVVDANGNPVVDADGKQRTILKITGRRSGTQLMKLQTTVIYQGIEFVYDYYFLIVVDLWTDEDAPTIIESGAEFVDYLTNSDDADDYILMNDIVLNDYTPLDTDKVKSLDGNGFVIHLNSFKMPTNETALNLALFNTVHEDTTLKNVTVNIYNGGQITANVAQIKTINVAGFALRNNGVIYNCSVVAYYDADNQSSRISGDVGLVVKYTDGENTAPIKMAASKGVQSTVAGFVLENNASITNSRVGGESLKHIVELAEDNYVSNQSLGVFVIEGQGEVAGFVGTNAGDISASFADKVQIYNNLDATTSRTAGFALYNNSSIQTSYVEGDGEFKTDEETVAARKTDTNITSMGYIAGFVYSNTDIVKNCYSNIAIEGGDSKGYLVAGFVYINEAEAEVELCYTACEITKYDISEMQFSGVDAFANSLNDGKITLSYYFNEELAEGTNQAKLASGALAVRSTVDNEDNFYGFSFASGDDTYDGIWRMTEDEGLTLVAANQIALSNRYTVTNGDITSFFYSKNILDVEAMKMVDLTYGSEYNPIIIRSAYDFAMATGSTSGGKHISSYKEYYNDKEVFGYYRLVNDIDMTEIDQNAEGDGSVALTTTTKTFKGVFDGNGFTISNISLGSSDPCENYGLFAKTQNSVIMSLDLVVESIHNTQASVVGTLAGTAIDSEFVAINVTPVLQQGGDDSTSVQGRNIVGGVVGMLFGDSTMNDISIENIEIYSSFYDENKTIASNSTYTGIGLRQRVISGVASEIDSYVQHLSYAGAVAGYVDTYDMTSQAGKSVTFTTSLEVNDYQLVTINVSDSVNIYAEVAGGLFGYVGDATLVYDANIRLDADMALSNPSYIISKNLYAGGLIGENYGGLFAVTAAYDDDLQAVIEANENNYYNGNTSVERGQQSIFSYTPNDEGYVANTNEPMFVGGLVGFMGGGYVHIGYNKLNVISHSAKTLAVGGIVGFAGYVSEQYKLASVANAPEVNLYLREVYAAGDVAVDVASDKIQGATDRAYKGISAGIVGAIEQQVISNDDIDNVVLALEKVLAVNYYSVASNKLVGDVNPSMDADENLVSDKHFMLVGQVLQSDSVGKISNKTDLAGSLYVISTETVINMNDDQKNKPSVGAATVGGYNKVVLGEKEIRIKSFGMSVKFYDGENKSDEATHLDSIYMAQIDSIGANSMSTASARYAQMYSYFLGRGWTFEYWNHEQEELFPEVELTPKMNVVFWDDYNTAEVLESMKDSAITVVVRGKKIEDETDQTYVDIDLTKHTDGKGNELITTMKTISEFKGTLISYYNYSGVDIALLSGRSDEGGKAGDRVGIILNQALFSGLNGGASIIGVTFYFADETESEAQGLAVAAANEQGTQSKTPRLIEGAVEEAVLRDLTFVYNGAVNVAGGEEIENVGENVMATGLVANVANATSFINISFVLRAEKAKETDSDIVIASSATEEQAAMGLLAGIIRQNRASVQVTVENVSIEREENEANEDDNPIVVEFKANGQSATAGKDQYAGLYAGIIEKTSGNTGSRGKITVGLTTLRGIDVKLSVAETEEGDSNLLPNVYLGGFAGKIGSVDNVTLSEAADADQSKTLNIIQAMDVNNLYAGLGFGSVVGGSFNIEGSGAAGLTLAGKIYDSIVEVKGENETRTQYAAEQAQIGGIAGTLSAKVSLSSFSVDFSIGGRRETANVFEENLYDYSSEIDDADNGSYGVLPFVIGADSENNAISSDNSAVGGFFGYVNAEATLTGTIETAGTFELDGDVIVGGLIGRTDNAVSIGVSAVNNVNMAVLGDEANVGGLIGYVAGASTSDELSYDVGINSSENPITALAMQNEGMYYQYNGTVLSAAKTLNFGGAVGKTSRTAHALNISNFVFGGAVKVFGEVEEGASVATSNDGEVSYNYVSSLNGASVTVGGVVGNFDGGATEMFDASTISNCFSYGDVFVNYLPEYSNIYLNEKLSTYNFGGIVGSAWAGVSVAKCLSLMTSFNDRMVRASGDSYNQNVHAIVGKNEVSYGSDDDANYYNSGVCLAYQEEAGNVDVAYIEGAIATLDSDGEQVEYSGYINGEPNTGGSTMIGYASKLGLENWNDLVGEAGGKLNPYVWTSEDGKQLGKTGDGAHAIVDETSTTPIAGESHGILWVTLTQNISTKTQIADELSNVALVGNGWTISSAFENSYDESASGDTIASYGGLVNKMGERNGNNPNFATPTFNVVSSLVLELDVNVDINRGDTEKTDYFGGVTGATFGHSIIYGVGVRGKLSVGGSNQKLWLGGLVGGMHTGRIEECYEDADITYRGSDGGVVSGIANMLEYNTLVKAVYSSGLIETYSANNIYTLARANSTRTWNDLMDCYSISQIKRNVDAESSTNNLVSTAGVTTKHVYNGCFDVTNYSSDYDKSEMALAYSDNSNISSPSLSAAVAKEGATADDDSTFSNWRFNRCLNYGYASHNFGWLSNVTTYTKNEDVFEAVDYSEIAEAFNADWYLGVPNTGKFEQMLATVSNSSNPLKYVLRYDFNLYKMNEGEPTAIDNIGKDVGAANGAKFALEGNGKTLDAGEVVWEKPLFGDVYGNITNLRLTNVQIGKADSVSNASGTLATSLTGTLSDITVTGSITSSASIVGGVVGTLSTEKDEDLTDDKIIGSTKIDSLVNVTTSGSASYIGGIAGKMTSGTLSLSSNAGQIINNSSGDATAGRLKPAEDYSSDDGKIEIDAIVGGLVGETATGTTIVNSYNSNAVLTNFTESNDKDIDVIAGGIVGHGNGNITSCYNTGYVGAGNYSAPGYSFAGGIVGYASGGTISGCINDATVESIGKPPELKKTEGGVTVGEVTVSVVDEWGSVVETSYTDAKITENNAKVSYTVSINYGQVTYVNAYGVGYLNGASQSGNSSTDNVVVDGRVATGDYTTTGSIDRRQTANDFGSGQFNLFFVPTKQLFSNGVDSYGLPVRFYTTETVTKEFKGFDEAAGVDSDYSNLLARHGMSNNDAIVTYNGVWEKTDNDFAVIKVASDTGGFEGKKTYYTTEGVWRQKGSTSGAYEYYSNGNLNYVYPHEGTFDGRPYDAFSNMSQDGFDGWSTEGVANYGIIDFVEDNKNEYWNSYIRTDNEEYVTYDLTYHGRLDDYGSPFDNAVGRTLTIVNSDETLKGWNGSGSTYKDWQSVGSGSTSTATYFISTDGSLSVDGETLTNGYDSIIANRSGWLTNGSSISSKGTKPEDDLSLSVNKALEVLAGEKENKQKEEVISVNGQWYAIVNNAEQFTTLSNPYSTEFTITFNNVEKIDEVETTDLSKNFEVLKADHINEYTYSINPGDDGNSIKITGKLLGTAEIGPDDFSITLKQTIVLDEFTLTKNNVERAEDVNRYRIILQDNDSNFWSTYSALSQTLKDKGLTIKLRKGEEVVEMTDVIVSVSGGKVYVTASMPTEEGEASPMQLVGAEGNVLYDTVEVYAYEYVTETSDISATITPSQGSLDKTISGLSETRTFVENVVTSAEALGGFAATTELTPSWMAGADRFAFGLEGKFGVSYDASRTGSKWQLVDGSENVVGSLTVDNATVTLSDSTLTISGDGAAVLIESLNKEKLHYIGAAMMVNGDSLPSSKEESFNITGYISGKVEAENITAPANFTTDLTYGGSNLGAEAGENVSVREKTKFGMPYYEADVIYVYSGNATITATTSLNATIQHNGSNVHSGWLASGQTKTISNVKNGDTISILACLSQIDFGETAPDTTYALASSDLTVWKDGNSIGTLTGTSGLAGTTTSYSTTVTTETATFEYKNEKGEIESETVPITTKTLRYEATVNNSGVLTDITFTLEEKRLTESGMQQVKYVEYSTQSGETNKVIYAYTTDTTDENTHITTITVDGNGNPVEISDEEKAKYNVTASKSEAGLWTCSFVVSGEAGTTTEDGEISAFAILAGISEDNVTFYSCDNGYSFQAAATATVSTIALSEEASVFELFGTLVQTDFYNTYTVGVDNFEYREKDSGTGWREAANETPLKLGEDDDYGTISYEARKETRTTVNPSLTTTGENQKNADIKDISRYMLGDDILGFGATGNNTKDLFGRGHYVEFYDRGNSSDDAAMFGSNTAIISDLSVVGISSLQGAAKSGNYSLLTNSNSGTISNVKIYGNMRNLGSENNAYVKAEIVNTENAASAKVENVKSYVIVNGENATSESKDVNSIIEVENEKIENHDILIAGNGANGINNNGYGNGSSGGKGGDVTAQGKGGSIIIARAGRGGIGGYGPNGKNSYYGTNPDNNDTNYVWRNVNLKGAGNAGGNGSKGSLSCEKEISNRTLPALKDDTNSSNYRGNTGMAGLKFISTNNTYGLSEGVALKWKYSDTIGASEYDGNYYKRVAYGPAASVYLYWRFNMNNSLLYEEDEGNELTMEGKWISNIREKIKNATEIGNYYINFQIAVDMGGLLGSSMWYNGVLGGKLVIYPEINFSNEGVSPTYNGVQVVIT